MGSQDYAEKKDAPKLVHIPPSFVVVRKERPVKAAPGYGAGSRLPGCVFEEKLSILVLKDKLQPLSAWGWFNHVRPSILVVEQIRRARPGHSDGKQGSPGAHGQLDHDFLRAVVKHQ